MVFSKGDLRKKKCCAFYMGRGKKGSEMKGKFWVFKSPSKGLVLFGKVLMEGWNIFSEWL